MKSKFKNPASTVDLIVEEKRGVVLIRRKHNPYKGFWALPGGYLNCGKETLEEAGSRELFEETNLRANPNSLELVGVYSEPKRDPRGHVISHVFRVAKYLGQPKAKDDACEIGVFRRMPKNIAFDHRKIYKDYRAIRDNIRIK